MWLSVGWFRLVLVSKPKNKMLKRKDRKRSFLLPPLTFVGGASEFHSWNLIAPSTRKGETGKWRKNRVMVWIATAAGSANRHMTEPLGFATATATSAVATVRPSRSSSRGRIRMELSGSSPAESWEGTVERASCALDHQFKLISFVNLNWYKKIFKTICLFC